MECNASSLNVRSGSSIYSSIIGKIPKGEKVQVVYKTSTGWSKIKFNDRYGYVSSQYLIKPNEGTTPKPDPTPGDITIMKCNASLLNVRSGASTSSTVVGKLRKGDKVEVIEQLSSGWSKIKFNNNTAYVSTVYLSN